MLMKKGVFPNATSSRTVCLSLARIDSHSTCGVVTLLFIYKLIHQHSSDVSTEENDDLPGIFLQLLLFINSNFLPTPRVSIQTSLSRAAPIASSKTGTPRIAASILCECVWEREEEEEECQISLAKLVKDREEAR